MSTGTFIDRTLGNWRLVRLLGEGAFGVVYEAVHTTIAGRRAAVKVLHLHMSLHTGIKQRFLNEASAASRAEHENIIQIFDGGITDDGTCYSVMELLRGRTLTELIGDGRLTIERAFTIVAQIASALQAAHELEIVHRDLKPDNIFIVARAAVQDFVKILDFGVAKLRDQSFDVRATRAGVQIGTPAYMSPEQWMALPDVDGRADIYALGIILYECLTGSLPFQGSNAYEWQVAHLTTPAPELDDAIGAPYELRALLRGMLAKDRKERPRNMLRVIELLQEMEPTQQPRLLRTSRPPEKRSVEIDTIFDPSSWDAPTRVDPEGTRAALDEPSVDKAPAPASPPAVAPSLPSVAPNLPSVAPNLPSVAPRQSSGASPPIARVSATAPPMSTLSGAAHELSSPVDRGRRRAPTLAIVGALVLLACGAGLVWLRHRSGPIASTPPIVTQTNTLASDTDAGARLASDLKSQLAAVDAAMSALEWKHAVALCDQALAKAPGDAQWIELRRRAQSEVVNAAHYDIFEASLGASNDDDAVAAFARIAADSVYREKAIARYDQALPRYIADHLARAHKRSAGCAEMRRQAEAVIKVDAENAGAAELLRHCQSGARSSHASDGAGTPAIVNPGTTPEPGSAPSPPAPEPGSPD